MYNFSPAIQMRQSDIAQSTERHLLQPDSWGWIPEFWLLIPSHILWGNLSREPLPPHPYSPGVWSGRE